MYDKSFATILDYHRSMVCDTVRVDALRRAIEQTVRPGDQVLDLGCGTGLLALLACQAGAARVVAVDSGPVIELARQLGRQHGQDDRIEFVQQHSADLRLDTPADVLLTETLGNGGFDEGILGTVLDARRRLLRPGASIVPRALRLRLCAVDLPAVTQRSLDWPRDLHGLDLSTLAAYETHQLRWQRLQASHLLSSAEPLPRVDLTVHETVDYEGSCRLVVDRDATLHALGGWFEAELADGIPLANPPNGDADALASSDSWQQVVLPVEPMEVHRGDKLDVQLRVQQDGALWSWTVQHSGGVAPLTRQGSTFFGTFLSSNSLRRQSESFQPRLNDDGAIERWVLERMDGQTSVLQLAQEIQRRFPQRFSQVDDALTVVRGICRRFGR